jgi:enamine deaminase RidA (YjgF/YER057c/UK114 family)
MIRRFLAATALALCLFASAVTSAADSAAKPAVRYLPLDAPAGMSQAVVVERAPLVYTRQLFPTGSDGKLVGEGSAEKQSEQIMANLETVLKAAGSDLDKLVRVNVYALSHEAAGSLREQLRKRLDPAVRPAVTVVLTPLPHRRALVAVDAIAVAADKGEGVSLLMPCVASDFRSAAGQQPCADAARLPPGGVAYLAGVPAAGGLTTSAVANSLGTLSKTLAQLKLSPANIVQMKVFLSPASSAQEVLREIEKAFPGGLTPPVVFVEWIAAVPVEIELVAQLPPTKNAGAGLQYYTPPDVRPSPGFSRVALVCAPRQIFISGLSPRVEGTIGAQTRDVFRHLEEILAAAGSDMGHLAKATYYVSEDNAGHALNKVRPEFFDPDRPPAASKVTVHGVGQPGRTLTVDAIAVGAAP